MAPLQRHTPENFVGAHHIHFSTTALSPTTGTVLKKEGENRRIQVVALRTRWAEDIINDGFKWRKYGKKMIKSNPIHPRNYYKCSSKGCKVKKMVERDRDDSSYVMTTYKGVHNHPTPHNMSIILSINHWALQEASSHSHFS